MLLPCHSPFITQYIQIDLFMHSWSIPDTHLLQNIIQRNLNQFINFWVAFSEKILLLLNISAAFSANPAAFLASAVYIYSKNLQLDMRPSAKKLKLFFPLFSTITLVKSQLSIWRG